MKKCPNPYCNNTELHSDELLCCPYCGTDLESIGHSRVQIGNDSGVNKGYHTNASIESGDDVSNVKIGNDNTFTGGVHSSDDHTKVNSDNQVHTNSHNTTNNTTIYQAAKSNSEKFEEDKLSYRLKCKELFVNGFISKEDEKQLRELQTRLNLADEIVSPIKDEIRQHSRKRIQPTAQVISGVRQTKSIIELNNDASLLRQLKQLESWMREYDDDTLKLMYYQMSAILEPAKFIGRYEKSAKNEYWEAYWAYIAYMKQAQDKQSFDARALSEKLGLYAGQPESNDVILHLAGRLMQDDPIDDIAKERNTLTANYSSELKPLLDAIDELLQKDWAEEAIHSRPVLSFYVKNLFTCFVETQTAAGKKRLDDIRRKKEEDDYISRAEREKQEEIKRQKDSLLQRYQEVEDIRQACNDLKIPYLSFRTWLEEDLVFNSLYYETTRHIEEITTGKAEIEAKTQRQKSDFKNRYEQNNCDFFRTCSELDLNSNIVKKWREEDKAFDDALTSIERENERVQHEEFIKCYELNDCDFQRTCADIGVSMDIVNNWRKSNLSFDEALTSIKCEYDRALQDAFVRYYALNDCNIQKTCDELNLSKATIREWRDLYESFNESLLDIELERDARIAREARARRRKAFMKSLPYIIIGLLISLIVVAALVIKTDYNSEITKYEKCMAKMSSAQNDLDIADIILEAATILKDIKRLESNKSMESIRLTRDLEDKCAELDALAKLRVESDFSDVKSDGKKLQNKVKKIRIKLKKLEES